LTLFNILLCRPQDFEENDYEAPDYDNYNDIPGNSSSNKNLSEENDDPLEPRFQTESTEKEAEKNSPEKRSANYQKNDENEHNEIDDHEVEEYQGRRFRKPKNPQTYTVKMDFVSRGNKEVTVSL